MFRLHTAADFSRVFAARSKLRGKYFDLHYSACDPLGAENARLGLVVAKKLARRAVQRNLLKRLARESFRHARGGGRLPSYDLVLRLARPPGSIRGSETESRIVMRQLWRADIDQLLERFMERSGGNTVQNKTPQNPA
ncbi:MAG: ribonuclease P protein component [Sterolibacterium sp.]|jgi:ribonuclease P protein component|nr:ribonuclease P protein component [Sterolibacterium sp.]